MPSDADEVLKHLERIQILTGQLAKARGDAIEAQAITEKIWREIEAAKIAVKPFRTYEPT
jgi:hypothetical protein